MLALADDELTLSQASREFCINRSTLTVWVWAGKIPSRREVGELGIEYYVLHRQDIQKYLDGRTGFGRPLRRIDKPSVSK